MTPVELDPQRAPVPDPDDSWVAIDFETATRARDSACALGISVIAHGVIVESGAWLIRPPRNEYEYWNTRVHGITPDHTADAPTFAGLWPIVLPYLDGADVLAHNASFDMGVLRASLVSAGLEAPAMRYVCTVQLSRRAFPDLERHRLDTMCDHCGIELQHHDAASDALACAAIALRCRDVAGAPTLAAAISALGVHRHRFRL